MAKVGGGLGRVARRLRWGVVGGEGSGGVTGWVRAGRVYSTRAGNRRVHDTHPLEIVGLDSGVATQGQQVLVVGEEARDERVASARHHHVRRVLRVLEVPHLGHSYSARKRVKVGVRVRQHHIAWLLQPLHDAATCSVVATRSWPGRRLPDANKPEDEPKEEHGSCSSSSSRARCWRRVSATLDESRNKHPCNPLYCLAVPSADGRAERARGARYLRARRAPPLGQRVLAGGRSSARASSAAACSPSGGRTPRSSTTVRRPRTRAGKRPWAGRSRGRGCTPAFCVRGVAAAGGPVCL